jgi:hypothetical protein
MNNETQTAVEWMFEQFFKVKWGSMQGNMPTIFEQAKEMEKEQTIAFGKKCFYKGFQKAENDDSNCFTAWRECVYELINTNETYKTK